VLGYTVACDVTARDLQRKDVQFTRAKGFDTFCPVGPWIETELHTGDLAISCTVSGSRRQDGRTRDMVFDVPTLVSAMSHAMTLEPGDFAAHGHAGGGSGRSSTAIVSRWRSRGSGALTVRVEKLA
jgi:2-keto-4-pentenoate hydratase/2-oxohepta-3-ene-1,7-dioic acid hydratase in catechol pathway